jgi:hypothetical protein
MTAAQQTVLDAVETYGPLTDAALVPLVQHVSQARMSSSGVRTRRSELTDQGLVKSVGQVRMPSGRFASEWAKA